MINVLVCDLIESTSKKIDLLKPQGIEDIRRSGVLVGFSEELRGAQREMKRFLSTQLYQHFQVLRMTQKAKRIIRDLFSAFSSEPRMLPPRYQSAENQARGVADYIAGMTDRYAMKEHRRLFAVGEI
jgi:dGTPase